MFNNWQIYHSQDLKDNALSIQHSISTTLLHNIIKAKHKIVGITYLNLEAKIQDPQSGEKHWVLVND